MRKILLSLVIAVLGIAVAPVNLVYADTRGSGVDGGVSGEPAPSSDAYKAVEEEAVNEGNAFFEDCLRAGYSASACYDKQKIYTAAVKEYLARKWAIANEDPNIKPVPQPVRGEYMPTLC